MQPVDQKLANNLLCLTTKEPICLSEREVNWTLLWIHTSFLSVGVTRGALINSVCNILRGGLPVTGLRGCMWLLSVACLVATINFGNCILFAYYYKLLVLQITVSISSVTSHIDIVILVQSILITYIGLYERLIKLKSLKSIKLIWLTNRF